MQPIPYEKRVATVVGGRGQLGSRVVKGLQGLGIPDVRICEKGDPFRGFVGVSTDVFLATDAKTTKDMLAAARDLLDKQTVLDGASVKAPLIPFYRSLDKCGISVCSTHLGAVPAHPWGGVKVWVCEVGPNSERAKQLAVDLFLSKNTSIQLINIKDHWQVEQDQWFTFAVMHIFAAALRESGLSLGRFNAFATLNAELAALPLGRTLGQGTIVPSEVLFTQPRKRKFFGGITKAFQELKESLKDRKSLQEFMQRNISFHDSPPEDPPGSVNTIFTKAGIVGARNANLRMFSIRLRITDNKPGNLIKILEPFRDAGANITAIDSMPGVITPEEEQHGIDPDSIVNFDIGIDPRSLEGIDNKTWLRVNERLYTMGCRIDYDGYFLNR